MRHYILTLIFITSNCLLYGQSNDTWTPFWNKDTTLIGFKDKDGVVKIEPKFMGFTFAKKFENIIAVSEGTNEKWTNYYLTKSGRVVGRDSLHIFDNGADCESEGFIRFRDRKTDKVGMFNKNGDIVIPAVYNDLTRVRNGMVIALKGAEKKHWNKNNHSGCDHFSWTGGKELLIDTNNNVLIENFKYTSNLNFFSLLISVQPSEDTLRVNFKATDNSYYSFIDFDKEFKMWLKTNLLDDFTKEKLIKSTYDKITWSTQDGWQTESNYDFIQRNFELIKSKLLETTKTNCDYFITTDGLNPFMFESKDFSSYYNNCGESKDWIYPIKTIIINHKDDKNLLQDHFEFLRTDNGYKLLCVTIRSGKIE